jgi:hypothetical protein
MMDNNFEEKTYLIMEDFFKTYLDQSCPLKYILEPVGFLEIDRVFKILLELLHVLSRPSDLLRNFYEQYVDENLITELWMDQYRCSTWVRKTDITSEFMVKKWPPKKEVINRVRRQHLLNG